MPARRTAVWLTATMLAAALAPVAAEANHSTPVWQDGGAAVPASVDLEDVSANSSSGVVIAVGKDTSTGDAVIYRYAEGQWVQDSFSPPAGGSTLVGVDLSEDAAWAVGTSNGGSAPFVLRITGGESELEDSSAASWAVPAMGTLPADPSAVAINVTDGLIGTDSGAVHPVHEAASGTVDAAITATPAAGPINAIAIYARDATTGKLQAYTAGDDQPAAEAAERVFKVDTGQAVPALQMVPVGMGPSDPDFDLVGIGAASESEAVAIEENDNGDHDPRTWDPPAPWAQNASTPDFTAASKPDDLTVEKPNAVVLRAVAGEHGGDGAVWRNNGGSGWVRSSNVSPEPLNGVAILGDRDIWAVGDDGAVKHYAPPPDPPAPDTSIDSGPPSETPDPTPTFTFSSVPAGASFECSLDGANYVNCASPETLGPLPLGLHYLDVRAREGTSVDPSPDSHAFTVVPPDTTISVGPSGTTNDTTPTFSFFSDLDSASFECSVDGAAFTPCTSPRTTGELAAGAHSFEVRAVSSAGTDLSPASRNFTVEPPPVHCVDVPRPLIRDVVVRKLGGALKIEFVVAALARVRAKAFHGDKLIGRTKEKVFKPGARSLRLRWKGDLKPTRLKMSAKPAAPNACT